MAWGSAPASAMFRAWPQMVLGNYGANSYVDLSTDTVKVSLHNNSVTPDRDAAITSTGYDTGTWANANALADTDGSSDWTKPGITLGSKAFTTPSTGVLMFDAADTTHANTVTITDAHGCLVYDDATTAGTGGVADQGISFHYFGGAQSVTTGTFTVVWHANGLFRITV